MTHNELKTSPQACIYTTRQDNSRTAITCTNTKQRHDRRNSFLKHYIKSVKRYIQTSSNMLATLDIIIPIGDLIHSENCIIKALFFLYGPCVVQLFTCIKAQSFTSRTFWSESWPLSSASSHCCPVWQQCGTRLGPSLSLGSRLRVDNLGGGDSPLCVCL